MIIKPSKNIVFYLIIISFLASCAPVYTPNVINTPLFTEKGESQINMSVGLNGYDPQLAFALTDHVGIMINGCYQNKQDDSSTVNSIEWHKHIFAEAAIGYYYPIEEKYRLEIFGGVGQGTVWSHFENNFVSKNAKANYTRYFLQPNIGICTDYYEVSFSPRLSLVDMQLYDEEMSAFNTTGIDIFVEPAITAKFGYKFIKFFVQTGFVLSLSQNVGYNHKPFFFSAGLHAKIAPRKKQDVPLK